MTATRLGQQILLEPMQKLIHSRIRVVQQANPGVIIIYHQQEAGQTVGSVLCVVRQQNPISQLDPSSVIDTHGSDG